MGDEDSLISHVELIAWVVSSIINNSDLKKVDALSVEDTLALMLQGTASVRPSAFIDPFPNCFILLIYTFLFFGRWLLTRRAWQGGPALSRETRAAKSYKSKVASLTFERVGLRAQIRDLIEELMKHRYDLKHASTERVRAEDKEKKAQKDLKVAKDELRLAKEELQAVKGDLCAKVTTLDRVLQEASEVGSSVEHLTEVLGKLRMDLERQEALASRRGEVIAELRDEACTQRASGWLAF